MQHGEKYLKDQYIKRSIYIYIYIKDIFTYKNNLSIKNKFKPV